MCRKKGVQKKEGGGGENSPISPPLDQRLDIHKDTIRVTQKRDIFSSHFFARGNAMVTRKFKTSGASSCNSMLMFPKVNSLRSY